MFPGIYHFFHDILGLFSLSLLYWYFRLRCIDMDLLLFFILGVNSLETTDFRVENVPVLLVWSFPPSMSSCSEAPIIYCESPKLILFSFISSSPWAMLFCFLREFLNFIFQFYWIFTFAFWEISLILSSIPSHLLAAILQEFSFLGVLSCHWSFPFKFRLPGH